MTKLAIYYQQPKDKDGFEQYYFTQHAPLAQKVPNIKDTKVRKVIQTQQTELKLYLIVELEFADLETLQQTMATPEWQAVMQDAKQLLPYLNEPPFTVITE